MTRPISQLEQWAALNNASFHNIHPASAGEHRGSGLIATKDLSSSTQDGPLLTVPRDLVLSKETVELLAKSDRDLRALLDALGDFVHTSRGAIVAFLLYCRTMNGVRDSGSGRLGTLSPFNEYVRFLPAELLPTFWNDSEISLLHGTSLYPALTAKHKSLSREFDTLRARTEGIPWCQTFWWNPSPTSMLSPLELDDWKTVDAQYRSRALEFPGIGDAMVPLIDMANHASGFLTSALYETDEEGNAVLLLRPGKEVKEGEEVTITYGDGKGACEMLFSYGFIEALPSNSPNEEEDARQLFLPLEMSEDDPLAPAKKHISPFAPGVKIYHSQTTGEIEWHSEFVYLSTLNQEDGLDFAVAQTTTGERELQVLWKGTHIPTSSLSTFITSTLKEEEFWEIFHLRATVTILERVRQQLDLLPGVDVEKVVGEWRADGEVVRERCVQLAVKLRELEGNLLMSAVSVLEAEIEKLSQSEVVGRWFALQQQEQEDGDEEGAREEEDFT